MLAKFKNIWNKVSQFTTEGTTPMKIFFLVLAIFLWFLTKLSKDGYTQTIDFPVAYKNISSDKNFGEKPPNHLDVTITSEGFNIMRYILPNFVKLKVNVEEVERKTRNGKSYWLTNTSLENIASQLGPEVQVRAISPDTVFFDFQKLTKKRVAVNLKFQGEFPASRIIYQEPRIEPDSIWVSGPQSMLKTLKQVSTEDWAVNSSKDSVDEKLNLNLPKDKILKFSHEEVKVKIRFTDVTESSLEIPVSIQNIPVGYELKVFPSDIKVAYHVAMPDFAKVIPSDFEIMADYAEIEDNPDRQYLQLALKTHPDYVDYISFEPKRVEYLLIAK